MSGTSNPLTRWFADRRLRTKVLSLLAVCLVAATAVGVTGLVAVDAVNDRVTAVRSEAVLPQRHLTRV